MKSMQNKFNKLILFRFKIIDDVDVILTHGIQITNIWPKFHNVIQWQVAKWNDGHAIMQSKILAHAYTQHAWRTNWTRQHWQYLFVKKLNYSWKNIMKQKLLHRKNHLLKYEHSFFEVVYKNLKCFLHKIC